MLLVLVGLKEDGRESAVAADGIWRTKVTVAGIKTAVFEHDEWVGLAAGQSTSSVEIQIVNVDVAVVVGGSDVGAE